MPSCPCRLHTPHPHGSFGAIYRYGDGHIDAFLFRRSSSITANVCWSQSVMQAKQHIRKRPRAWLRAKWTSTLITSTQAPVLIPADLEPTRTAIDRTPLLAHRLCSSAGASGRLPDAVSRPGFAPVRRSVQQQAPPTARTLLTVCGGDTQSPAQQPPAQQYMKQHTQVKVRIQAQGQQVPPEYPQPQSPAEDIPGRAVLKPGQSLSNNTPAPLSTTSTVLEQASGSSWRSSPLNAPQSGQQQPHALPAAAPQHPESVSGRRRGGSYVSSDRQPWADAEGDASLGAFDAPMVRLGRDTDDELLDATGRRRSLLVRVGQTEPIAAWPTTSHAPCPNQHQDVGERSDRFMQLYTGAAIGAREACGAGGGNAAQKVIGDVPHTATSDGGAGAASSAAVKDRAGDAARVPVAANPAGLLLACVAGRGGGYRRVPGRGGGGGSAGVRGPVEAQERTRSPGAGARWVEESSGAVGAGSRGGSPAAEVAVDTHVRMSQENQSLRCRQQTLTTTEQIAGEVAAGASTAAKAAAAVVKVAAETPAEEISAGYPLEWAAQTAGILVGRTTCKVATAAASISSNTVASAAAAAGTGASAVAAAGGGSASTWTASCRSIGHPRPLPSIACSSRPRIEGGGEKRSSGGVSAATPTAPVFQSGDEPGPDRRPVRTRLSGRELLNALAAARDVAEIQRLVSMYGVYDMFGPEHVTAALVSAAAALEQAGDGHHRVAGEREYGASSPVGRREAAQDDEASVELLLEGLSLQLQQQRDKEQERVAERGQVDKELGSGATELLMTPVATVSRRGFAPLHPPAHTSNIRPPHVSNPTTASCRTDIPSTAAPKLLAGHCVAILLDRLRRRMRMEPQALLISLILPRRLGLPPHSVWVLPLLTALVPYIDRLDPEPLVTLLSIMAEQDMWHYAPGSGTVARTLFLAAHRRLTAVLPKLSVRQVCSALASVALLAPAGTGPLLAKAAMRATARRSGVEMRPGPSRVHVAGDSSTGQRGAGIGQGGEKCKAECIQNIGGQSGRRFGSTVPTAPTGTAVATATPVASGEQLDGAFAAAVMSYIRTAQACPGIGPVDAVNLLHAIASFRRWPGAEQLRDLSEQQYIRMQAAAGGADSPLALYDNAGTPAIKNPATGSHAVSPDCSAADNDPVLTAAAPSQPLAAGGGGGGSGGTRIQRQNHAPQTGTDRRRSRSHPPTSEALVRPERRPALVPSTAAAAATATASSSPADGGADSVPPSVATRMSTGPQGDEISPPPSAATRQPPSPAPPAFPAAMVCLAGLHSSLPQSPPNPTAAPDGPLANDVTPVVHPATAVLLQLLDLLPAPPPPPPLATPTSLAPASLRPTPTALPPQPVPRDTSATPSAPPSPMTPNTQPTHTSPPPPANLLNTFEPHSDHGHPRDTEQPDLELYVRALWAMVRLGARPSPPWLSALLAVSGPRLTALSPSALVRLWWALCQVRWAAGRSWQDDLLVALAAAAPRLTPSEVCVVLGGFGRWRRQPPTSWMQQLLLNCVGPQLPTYPATSCVALALALSRMAYRSPAPFWRPFLAHTTTLLPRMDGRQLLNMIWALRYAGRHGGLPPAWRAAFLTACLPLLRPGLGQGIRRRHAATVTQAGAAALPTGSARAGVAASWTPVPRIRAAATPPFTPMQLPLLLLSVAKAQLRPGRDWRRAFWAASAAALPYMTPVTLTALVNGVWRLRVSPPLWWVRTFFEASGAAMGIFSPSCLVQFAHVLLRAPLRPPGPWVAAYRARLDLTAATLTRQQLALCTRMVRLVSWRRRRTAPAGWRLNCARTNEQATERWRRGFVVQRRRRVAPLRGIAAAPQPTLETAAAASQGNSKGVDTGGYQGGLPEQGGGGGDLFLRNRGRTAQSAARKSAQVTPATRSSSERRG